MKIAFFHELPFGGARRVIDEYGKILKGKHQVDLYYVDKTEDQRVINFFNNVFFFKFTPKKWGGGDWKTKLYKDTIEFYKLFSRHKKIAEEIDSKGYDFVFVHPSQFTQAPFILRFLKKPKVYYCQEPLRLVYDPIIADISNLSRLRKEKTPRRWPDEFLRGGKITRRVYEKVNRAIRKQIDKTNINKASLVLANSKFSKKWIKESYGIEAPVCYLGVDADKFCPIEMKKTYDVLFLGQKDRIEGYDLLIRAIELFAKKPMAKVVERNKDGIGMSDDELVKAYNKAKIVVALSRNEPFGLIPIEAMACEVPVVAVSEGGFTESVIDGKTGFLIKRNPKDLYLTLLRLLKNAKLRKQLGANGREHIIQNWTWEKSVDRFLRILKENNFS